LHRDDGQIAGGAAEEPVQNDYRAGIWAGLPLATLDQDLQKAANKTGVKRFAARD